MHQPDLAAHVHPRISFHGRRWRVLLAGLIALACVAEAASAQAAPATRASNGGAQAAETNSRPAEAIPLLGEVQVAATARIQQTLVSREGPLTFSVSPSVLVGRPLLLSGSAPASAAGHSILIERFEGSTWQAISQVQVQAGGIFNAQWRAQRAGHVYLRAIFATAQSAARSATNAPSAEDPEITIYRPARATWYGPGFYGQRTACGQRMSKSLIGVAHRSLPCGTLVEVSYAGRSLVVPVIDRGPYRSGVNWDLTAHAAQLLCADGIAPIGALVVGRALNIPTLGTPLAPAGNPLTGGTTASAP